VGAFICGGSTDCVFLRLIYSYPKAFESIFPSFSEANFLKRAYFYLIMSFYSFTGEVLYC